MRIHTNTLIAEDLRNALRTVIESGLAPADIRVSVSEHGSRSHTRAFGVRLYVDSKEPGDGRRRTNSGHYGAGDKWAATYDEYGWFLSYVFAMDDGETMVPCIYRGYDDFHEKTKHAYRLPTRRDETISPAAYADTYTHSVMGV